MQYHATHWVPCQNNFIFLVFEERLQNMHYARYVLVSHLPVHTLKGRIITCNKDSIFGSREVSLLFAHEHLAQSCYEYINSITKGG